MSIAKERAKRLSDAIEKSGLTYKELEQKTGVAKSSIQRYASGETEKIPIDRLERLAQAIGADITYLMCWDEPSGTNPLHVIASEIPDDPGERVKALHERFGNKKTPSELPPRESAFAQLEKLSERDLLLVQKIIDSIIEVREDYPEE